MKVAIFTDTFLPQINGVTKTLSRMIDYFEQAGVDYIIFGPDNDQKPLELEENIQRILSFNFFLYPECKLAVPNYFKIKDKLATYQPDLIHLITPFNLGLFGLKYAISHDVPVVASYHTSFIKYLDYYHLDFLAGPIWKFFRWFHSHCQCNFCPSQDTLQKLAEQGIKDLKLWERGIDTELFSPQLEDERLKEVYQLKDKLTLLYVGRLALEKNLELLFKSLRELNEDYQEQIELVITGDGPLNEKLKQDAPNNVTFTGYLTGKKLRKIYATADIFVFPSVTETYGNVVLEAMASGLPVVGIWAGGVKENLIDNYNGLACQENCSQEFTAKLKLLIEKEQLRDKLATNAREYSLSKSWEEVFNKLVADYQEAIDR
ncbi:glycosyltransferase family 1 protein [Natroniella sulfidigena]|uniref:glycosyltransferase family 4 protein n=1 Tax=Natroniella sulfidigena TaxID=723921 RepID=UPI002009F3CD|nr:glycosyltransferase family 1 protein [Natroniella sulfidigena]MCK8816703.1 glycosyltransferase family 1 protein [Natroniella sulfidigena]